MHSKNIGRIALGTMVYRNIWLGNTYYNSCYLENLLNIRPRDLTVNNIVLLDIWWNLVSK